MRIALGADNAGANLKNLLKTRLEARTDVEITDRGVEDAEATTAYPHIALDVARVVAAGEADRGLLICGTGIGMAITANKVAGVRAALCADAETARGARRWNDANALALSLRTTSEALLEEMLDAWFDGEPSEDSEDLENVRHLDEIGGGS